VQGQSYSYQLRALVLTIMYFHPGKTGREFEKRKYSHMLQNVKVIIFFKNMTLNNGCVLRVFMNVW
jgi:hypothetical protein